MSKKRNNNSYLFKIIILVIAVGIFGVKYLNESFSNSDNVINNQAKDNIIENDKLSSNVVDAADGTYDNSNYEVNNTNDNNKHDAHNANNKNEDRANRSLSSDYHIPEYNSNRGGQIIVHKGFTLYYDADYKTPSWVGWHLTNQETMGSESRTDKFLPDPNVIGAKAYTTDYTRSGYDRGHMAPAADMKWDKKAMAESFYMNNICPQNPNLNRGDWNDLEELSRDLAKKYGSLYITCGPIYDNKYPKRIGNNKVAVPDAFYKVIFIDHKSYTKAFGFIFNNKAGNRPLKNYIVTVDSIEKRIGIDFMPTLDKSIQDKIESEKHSSIPQ